MQYILILLEDLSGEKNIQGYFVEVDNQEAEIIKKAHNTFINVNGNKYTTLMSIAFDETKHRSNNELLEEMGFDSFWNGRFADNKIDDLSEFNGYVHSVVVMGYCV